ncbi:hypothetical protein N0V88_004677 [Collariella sp. IMI 366227]|nr:hypothetical protein N0V88_004677 [Collariella sp. IMI 366227]
MMIMMMGHGKIRRTLNILSVNVDVGAFSQMVILVQERVQRVEHLIQTMGSDITDSDATALMESLITPMFQLSQTLVLGVSRIALLIIIGGGGFVKKPAPLNLLPELLRSVSNLLKNLLTRGPIKNLLNNLLGGVLNSGAGG